MMLNVRFYAQFKRDLKIAKKRHLDMEKLKAVIEMLRQQESLPPKYRDHALKGSMPDIASAIYSLTGCWCTR